MANPFDLSARNTNKLNLSAKARLVGRIKLSMLMGSGEKVFHEQIKKLETTPLFRKLFNPGAGAERAISFARPFRLKLSERFFELKDELAPGNGSLDVQSLVERREKTAALIKKIGEEKFSEYFLFNDSSAGRGEIAAACGLNEEEAGEIMEFVDELSAHEEFSGGSFINTGTIAYSKIAGIEKTAAGKFAIAYFLPHLSRGKYSIDYDKIASQKKRGFFTEEELAQIGPLVKELEAINVRKSLVHRVLENIIEFQKEFLETGDTSRLARLNQRTVADRLEVSASMVNRALYGRSVTIPAGGEYSLKEFFPSKKDVVKNVLKRLLAGEKRTLGDEELSGLVRDRYGFRVSRHLIQIYRKELGIAPAGKRNAARAKQQAS